MFSRQRPRLPISRLRGQLAFEFTAECRATLSAARDEAKDVGAESVAPEHLLLALTRQPEGTTVRLLADLGVDASRLPALLADEASRERARARGRTPHEPELPYTARAKHVLEYAMREAGTLSNRRVGAEHLVLGLVAEERGPAARVLHALGVTLERARDAAARDAAAQSAVARSAAANGPARFAVVIDDTSDRSIYEQITGQVQEAVATARLRAGDRLPPVRQLADELTVAPGTVARAYAELERLGVVVTEGARGTRVASRPRLVPAADRPSVLVGLLRPVAVAAFHLGAAPTELRDALAEATRGIFERADGSGGMPDEGR